jgi:16S rRNA G966 N2-methylase RsmD
MSTPQLSTPQSTIIVDPEFRNLIPPLQSEEYSALEKSLTESGCRDPLVVWSGKNILLDGHNRLKICKEKSIDFQTVSVELVDRLDAKLWIMTNQLSRRNLTDDQRAMIVAEIAVVEVEISKRERAAKGTPARESKKEGTLEDNMSPKVSNDRVREKAAKRSGLPERKIRNAMALLKDQPEKSEQVKAGKLTIKQAMQKTRNEAVLVKREEMAKASEKIAPSDKFRIIAGDMTDEKNWVESDHIITDPPYPKQFLPLYGDLAKLSAKFLKPDGFLVVMTGQTWLQEVLNLMTPHMRYYWTGCFYMPDAATAIADRSVFCHWKPLLFFVRKDQNLHKMTAFSDFFHGPKEDQTLHHWQQSELGMLEIIKKLCHAGQLVLDPFSGSGSTGAASLHHGCLYHGIELDEKVAAASITRLGDAL